MPSVLRSLIACSLLVLAFPATSRAADPFRDTIVPFVKTYCVECHGEKLAEAQLNLARYDSAHLAAEDYRQWEHVITFLQREEMPPETAKQPPPAQRAEILKLIRTVLATEGRKVAGDPGLVLPRRLSNAEYDHTIRDLTGVDIRPTRSFPVDPAAGEGFDNTGEALTMSPNLFAKLYSAAQHVADHALLTTTGVEFAQHPVATFADRTKFYEQLILQFYEQHKVDYAVYLTACWEYKHRGPGQLSMTIKDWADDKGLSSKYFEALYTSLQSEAPANEMAMAWLRRRWNALSGTAHPAFMEETREAIRQLAQDIQSVSTQLCAKETEAIVSNAGNGPIEHLARRRKTAAERDTFDPRSIQPARRLHAEFRNIARQPTLRIVLTASPITPQPPAAGGFVVIKALNFTTQPVENYNANDKEKNILLRNLLAEHAPEELARLKFGVHPSGDIIDAEALVIPIPGSLEIDVPVKGLRDAMDIRFVAEAELDRGHTPAGMAIVSLRDGSADPNRNTRRSSRTPILLGLPDEVRTSATEFCRLFPNRFYYVDDTRGLSAGFHLIEGFFRDDQPLCKHVLNDDENRELNRLWNEMEFVSEITEKMLRGFVFFERSERNFLKHKDFDPFKEEDPRLVEAATLERFERVYLDRSNVKAPIEELSAHPIHIFFEQIRSGLNSRREHLRQAESVYLKDLEAFARSAYRRPLATQELQELRTFFHQVATNEEHGIDQAVRASLVRILVSPHFCCRIDATPEGDTVQPLGEFALASRLSYFLWSSMPDAELLQLAEAGQLHDEKVMMAQTRRMLKDPKVSDFAREFFGQWLGYRNFLEQESIDRSVFKEFDDELRQSMFEEPTRLATHLIQQDRPVTELLNSDFTFVDQRLARHYGINFPGKDADWAGVDNLHGQGRGGILGMAVFLAKNSQPQRTSPVKRGFWVVHKVLGEHIPAPPADVVALPAKETDTNGKSIRELLAMHVEAEKCARCHRRFDSVGLSMEGFDAIGRKRSKDLAGRPVDDLVQLADGSQARGVPDFARHLVKERRGDFVRTLCRKLLGYALGRSLQLSDDVLLEEMAVALDKNGDRFVPLIETVVRSPQFRNQRSRDFSMARFRIENQGDRR